MGWILALLGGRLKLFLILGALAGALTVVSGAYVKGRLDCGNAVALQKLRDENRILRKSIQFLQEDGERADKDAADMKEYDKKAEDIEDNITTGDCFTRDDARRLRSLWGKT
tara:strand:- start:435 stop:770 length:336 start_codon:yes stop_codon:yes gene_type:complete